MPTLDERIEAARKLEGYTPGPWAVYPAQGEVATADGSRSVVCMDEPRDEMGDMILGEREEGDLRLIAAAPDLHRLALDLAAERERLLATLRRIAGKGDQVYCRDGHEECALLARAALASEPRA